MNRDGTVRATCARVLTPDPKNGEAVQALLCCYFCVVVVLLDSTFVWQLLVHISPMSEKLPRLRRVSRRTVSFFIPISLSYTAKLPLGPEPGFEPGPLWDQRRSGGRTTLYLTTPPTYANCGGSRSHWPDRLSLHRGASRVAGYCHSGPPGTLWGKGIAVP